jgi:hypothetical protein
MDPGGILRTLDEAARLWVAAGGGALPVSGSSMRPTFEDPARVWMKESSRAHFGDVLVYSSGTFLVVHRVVGRRSGPRYRTKGDGLPHLDTMIVPAGRALGIVVAIERDARRYRLDRAGARVYGVIVAVVSAVEGFFYRFAWRIDKTVMRLLLPGRGFAGPMVLRRGVDGCGRGAIGLLDRVLFRALHRPAATD